MASSGIFFPSSMPEEATFMEKQKKKMPTWHVWLFTLATFQIVAWIPYIFWCQGYCVSLLLGTELKSPLYLIWGRNGQIIFGTIWMRFGPGFSLKTDEWINADTHKCTGNVPGHITGAGVFSSAPSHTWISSSQNRGKRGRRAERAKRS